MIGREEPLRPFAVIRWARQQVPLHNLRPLEAHVLLVLATYANAEGVAWPSLKTIASECGLKPTKDGRNSSVSAAISRLEDCQLVWTVQGGSGQSARRELLFDPKALPSCTQEGSGAQPSWRQEGTDCPASDQPSCTQDHCLPSSRTRSTNEVPVNPEEPNCNCQECLPAGRKAALPAVRKAGNATPRRLADVLADFGYEKASDEGEAA